MKSVIVLVGVICCWYYEAVETRKLNEKVCEDHWSYKKNSIIGPTFWKLAYPTCNGKPKISHQSPINIDCSNLMQPSYGNKIINSNYHSLPNKSENYKLENNGHTLMFNLPKENQYRLQKGDKLYVPQQIHIHFGSETNPASEHSINGEQYIAEIHMVHRNIDDSADTLVIATFVKYKQNKKPSLIMKIIGSYKVKAIKKPGDFIYIHPLSMNMFLPYDINLETTPYINYKGSLTTPPCTENVDWIILLKEHLWTDLTILENLKTVIGCYGNKLIGNNRPIQKLHRRKIFGVNV